MARKRKCQRRDDSSSSDSSSCDDDDDDEMSSAATTPIRSSKSFAVTENRRNTRRREDKGIKQMLKELKEDRSEMRKQLKILCEINDETREIRKQVKKLTESHNELRKNLVDHINGSSGDDSAAPRSESNEGQPPRYRLEFTCKVNAEIEKGKIIKTDHGETISVALHDDHKQIVETGPLASATVMLVVVNGEFNQHGNQYNWLRKDFERSIKRPPQKDSAMGDVNNKLESIVSDCILKLKGGVKSHTGATILYNSSNKKVRLGVMLVSPTEERVLEGLSNPFFVRGHDRPARQSNPHYNGSKRRKDHVPLQREYTDDMPLELVEDGKDLANTLMLSLTEEQTLVGNDRREDQMFYMENASWQIPSQHGEIRSDDPVAVSNTNALSTESFISASIFQDHQFLLPAMYGASMDQATNSLRGTQFNMDQRALPVQLVWDRPNVGLRKSWNILDQLMPLYSCPPKFNNSVLPTVHLGSLTSTLKDVMHTTRRKKGVLIEPLEPDDSDEECVPQSFLRATRNSQDMRPLKRKLHCKYRLQFVNKLREAYYTWEKIKASDGGLLRVALFDENNMRITSGPLSSASVEVVVLHGDFNVDGQHYWTSEEFSSCVVYPKDGKELAPVLGGNRILPLVNGEACLCYAFFQITSRHARTGKFKMGVGLASSVHDERIQEGISEPFRVSEHRQKGLPPGFRFHPTDKELILHYLLKRVATVPYPVQVFPEVDINKFNPWDLPGGLYGEHERYFFSPWDPKGIYCAAGSGYWKSRGTDNPISYVSNPELGFKRAFVFYMGRVPRGTKTNWTMNVYSLDCDIYNSIKKNSWPTSSMQVDKWVLCKIYEKHQLMFSQSAISDQNIYQQKQQLSTSTDEEDLSQPVQYDSWTDLPPGFCFQPTDEELILHYLRNRAASSPCGPCPVPIIADVDIYKFDPRDLPGKALYGDKKWYFFSERGPKYGGRPNRKTVSGYGYWQATGTDKLIHDTATGHSIGVKKALVFYKGRPPKGTKTNWIMHEYRDVATKLEDWVLCRIFKKKTIKDDQTSLTEGLDRSCSSPKDLITSLIPNTTTTRNPFVPQTSPIFSSINMSTSTAEPPDVFEHQHVSEDDLPQLRFC